MDLSEVRSRVLSNNGKPVDELVNPYLLSWPSYVLCMINKVSSLYAISAGVRVESKSARVSQTKKWHQFMKFALIISS